MPKPPPDLLRALALLAGAVICAAAANGLARTDRKLAWTGWAPPAPAPPAVSPAPSAAPPAPPAPVPAAALPAAQVPAKPPQPAPAQSRRPSAAPPAAPAPDPRFAPAADAVIRDLSSADAWAAFQRRIPFLDARRSADFLEGHVAGAWSVPIWEADAAARITEFEARTNPGAEAPIVTYCSGGDCEDSRLLARKLVELGYRNLFVYRDGYPDWVSHGRPRQQGPRP